MLSPSRSRVEPLAAEDLPSSLELTLSDQVYIPKEQLSPALRNRLMRLAAFQNPEFYTAQSMRLPIWGKPRIISCAEDHEAHLALPRVCYEEVQTCLEDLKIAVSTVDQRVPGEPIDVSF